MEPKDSNTSSSRGAGSIYGSSSGMAAMKRSNLELDLVEFVRMAMIASPDPSSDDSLKTDGGDPSSFLPPDSAVSNLGSASTTWEMNCFDETSSGELGVPLWCQTLMMKRSSIQATSPTPTGSQSSVFVGNAMSSNKPTVRDGQGRGATTRFAHEQLDDDDGEIETDSCEQSAEPNDKRIRRKISNRESARRSRKRKQEQLAGMETQVDCLMAEKATLSKQLTGAVQQYQVANTDNLVLKSNVEALRIKVQLAEAMVARGSIDSSFDNLLQSLNFQPSINSLSSIGYIANVPPSVTIPGDNDSSFTAGSTVTRQNSCIGAENGDSGNSSIANGNMGEALSCALQIWQ